MLENLSSVSKRCVKQQKYAGALPSALYTCDAVSSSLRSVNHVTHQHISQQLSLCDVPLLTTRTTPQHLTQRHRSRIQWDTMVCFLAWLKWCRIDCFGYSPVCHHFDKPQPHLCKSQKKMKNPYRCGGPHLRSPATLSGLFHFHRTAMVLVSSNVLHGTWRFVVCPSAPMH